MLILVSKQWLSGFWFNEKVILLYSIRVLEWVIQEDPWDLLMTKIIRLFKTKLISTGNCLKKTEIDLKVIQMKTEFDSTNF